jgi:hypothetical protein
MRWHALLQRRQGIWRRCSGRGRTAVSGAVTNATSRVGSIRIRQYGRERAWGRSQLRWSIENHVFTCACSYTAVASIASTRPYCQVCCTGAAAQRGQTARWRRSRARPASTDLLPLGYGARRGGGGDPHTRWCHPCRKREARRRRHPPPCAAHPGASRGGARRGGATPDWGRWIPRTHARTLSWREEGPSLHGRGTVDAGLQAAAAGLQAAVAGVPPPSRGTERSRRGLCTPPRGQTPPQHAGTEGSRQSALARSIVAASPLRCHKRAGCWEARVYADRPGQAAPSLPASVPCFHRR